MANPVRYQKPKAAALSDSEGQPLSALYFFRSAFFRQMISQQIPEGESAAVAVSDDQNGNAILHCFQTTIAVLAASRFLA